MLTFLFVICRKISEPPGAGNSGEARRLPPAWLEMVRGTRIRLGHRCVIGRAKENDLVIPSKCISRMHALVGLRETGNYWLSDLGSRNGTRVNGIRITNAVRLRDGDHVGIAQVYFTFRQRA